MRCEQSQAISKSQQQEQAIPMEIPNRSWQKLGADLFLQGGKWCLLITDYYSVSKCLFVTISRI